MHRTVGSDRPAVPVGQQLPADQGPAVRPGEVLCRQFPGGQQAPDDRVGGRPDVGSGQAGIDQRPA